MWLPSAHTDHQQPAAARLGSTSPLHSGGRPGSRLAAVRLTRIRRASVAAAVSPPRPPGKRDGLLALSHRLLVPQSAPRVADSHQLANAERRDYACRLSHEPQGNCQSHWVSRVATKPRDRSTSPRPGTSRDRSTSPRAGTSAFHSHRLGIC